MKIRKTIRSGKPEREQQKKKSRRRRSIILAVILAPIVAIVVMEIIAGLLSARGPYCASVDLTECEVSVKIYNDTRSVYKLNPCMDTNNTPCDKLGQPTILQPGESMSTSGRTDKDPPIPYMVVGEDGKVVGCINLQFTEGQPQPITVPLSKPGSCKPYL